MTLRAYNNQKREPLTCLRCQTSNGNRKLGYTGSVESSTPHTVGRTHACFRVKPENVVTGDAEQFCRPLRIRNASS